MSDYFNGATKYLGLAVAFLIGMSSGVAVMWEATRDIQASIENLTVKYDLQLNAIRGYIDTDSKKLILSGAAIRVAALEKDSKAASERLKVLEEFKIQGGRFTAKQGKELVADIRKWILRLEDKLNDLRLSGATIEFRLSSLEDTSHGKAK